MKANEYIKKRKKVDSDFASGYEQGLEDLKLSHMLQEARKKAGLTQEELANKIGTKRSAISRMEKHAKDLKVSTLEKVAGALGLKVTIQLS
jgi:ribosome-binding protein aMBF1 (putative translation factor)